MRIGIVDDDRLVCTSLKTILQTDPAVEVVGIGTSGQEAVALYRTHQPDVLLMDIRMEPMTGLAAGEAILRDFPQARILFLTTFSDDAYIVNALQIGAKGYILKQNFESILPALRAVMNGQSVFGDEIVGKLPDLLQKRARTADAPKLSERENALLERLAPVSYTHLDVYKRQVGDTRRIRMRSQAHFKSKRPISACWGENPRFAKSLRRYANRG